MRKPFIIVLGLILIIVAAGWKLGISPQADVRFPDGWKWEVNTIGLTSYAGENGQFAPGTTLKDDPINITTRSVTAEADGQPTGQVLISDSYVVRNAVTNAIDWEFAITALVDQKTGRHPNGDYYFPPRQVSRDQSYHVSNSSYQSLELTFQREEQIAGINTYLFAHYGDLDNRSGYPDQALEDMQTITCFDFQIEYWVEPATGEIVKFREWCEGDWVVNTGAGERLFALSRWGGETSGDDLIRSANLVQSQLSTYRMTTLYIPLGLAVIGLMMVLYGLIMSRRSGDEQTI
jgi:hypothetical protein